MVILPITFAGCFPSHLSSYTHSDYIRILIPYCVLSSVLGTEDTKEKKDSASSFKVPMVCEGGRHAQKPRAVSATDVTVNVSRGLVGSEVGLVILPD